MVLKISLPSGRHREGSKINHFDKFLFSPSKGSHRETPKIAGWIIFLCPSMGRARNIGFYALFSKIFCFRLQIGVSYQLLKERGSKLAQIFVCGIKIDAAFGSGISAVASKLMPFWLPPHLFPVGEAIYQGVFEKHSKILLLRGNPVIAPSLTPCLKAILWPPHLFPVGKAFFK